MDTYRPLSCFQKLSRGVHIESTAIDYIHVTLGIKAVALGLIATQIGVWGLGLVPTR